MKNNDKNNGKVPFMTNRIIVSNFNRKAFLDRYEIYVAVRDIRSESEGKFIKYEEITRFDGILSCFIGISRQPGNPHVAHFLVERTNAYAVLQCLRTEIPSLAIHEYQWTDEGVWDAIRLLSLSMSLSLEPDSRPQMVFSGRYYLSSPENFGVSASKRRKVCLEIGIDSNGLLIPRTVVFTPALKDKPSKRAQFIIEEPNRMSLVTDNERDKYIKDGYTIYEKRNPWNKKTIPWLLFEKGRTHEGKNHEVFWFVRRMNKLYSSFLKIEFQVIDNYEVFVINKKEIIKNMERYVCDMLTDDKIKVTDMCGNLDSESLRKKIINNIRERYSGIVSLSDTGNRLLEIQIVKPLPDPENREGFVDNYVHATEGEIIQHISYAAVTKSDSALSTITERLLLELAVKKSIITGRVTIPVGIADGWRFITLQTVKEKNGGSCLFKNRVGLLTSNACGDIELKSYELVNNWGNYQNIIDASIQFGLSDLVFLMIHNSNVYMLVDTMEVPVLNQEKIFEDDKKIQHDTDGENFFKDLQDKGLTDDGINIVKNTLSKMEKINKNGESVSKYRGCVGPKILKSLIKQLRACAERDKIVSAIEDYISRMHYLARRRRPEFLEEFFGGYTNIHVWWEEQGKTFCYIPSIDPDTLDMKESGMIMTMPHVRKVTLVQGSAEMMIADKDVILNMLKAGIGKYGAAMAYPYPYKLLKEYLSCKYHYYGI